MIITAVRYRTGKDQPYEALKFGAGTGRYRNYQCVNAPAPSLDRLGKALTFGLTGAPAPEIYEVTILLADDAGDNWVVERRAGEFRVLRGGQQIPDAEAAKALGSALMDRDGQDTLGGNGLSVSRFLVSSANDKVRITPEDEAHQIDQKIRAEISLKIHTLTSECAEFMGVPALAEPQKLARLSRSLEPLHNRWREVSHELNSISSLTEKDRFSPTELERLTREVDLAARIEGEVAPLLKPGVKLKALEADYARTEKELSESCDALGVSPEDAGDATRDLRKPLESMIRLEAYGRLVRASQAARKYCEQNVEPAFKKYIETAENHLVNDRQITAEIESCLATLNLRLRPETKSSRDSQNQKAEFTSKDNSGIRTWFEKFRDLRARGEEPRGREPSVGETQEEDTARMALEYTLSRLTEMGQGVSDVRLRFEGASQRIDQAHEELVQQYGRLKAHWESSAKAARLPTDIDLVQLTTLCVHQAGLQALLERAKELGEQVRELKSRAAKLARLVADWRILTGSQKQSDLNDLAMLLQEARDISRYKDAKCKRLAEVRTFEMSTRAHNDLKAMVDRRLKQVETDWANAWREVEMLAIPPGHKSWTECFKRASLVRGLALVLGHKPTEISAFGKGTEVNALSLFKVDSQEMDQKSKLTLISALEAAEGLEPRMILCSDPTIAAMLVSLGIGRGASIPQAKERAAAPRPEVKPRQAATIPARPSDRSAKNPEQVLLNERARAALDVLNGRGVRRT